MLVTLGAKRVKILQGSYESCRILPKCIKGLAVSCTRRLSSRIKDLQKILQNPRPRSCILKQRKQDTSARALVTLRIAQDPSQDRRESFARSLQDLADRL